MVLKMLLICVIGKIPILVKFLCLNYKQLWVLLLKI
jgi:hypothetical protein